MSASMPDLLKQQRIFFIAAIALTLIPNLVNSMIVYGTYNVNAEEHQTLLTVLMAIKSIINVAGAAVLSAYGIYMGRKGYLKKYVIYFYAIWLICYLVKYVLSVLPQFQAVYSGWAPHEKTLYAGISGFIAWIVIIFSVKGSLMNAWMKWGIGVGYILFSWIVGVIPSLLFSSAEMKEHPLLTVALPMEVVYNLAFILAGVGIYAYYNSRIRKAEKEIEECYS